MQALEPDIASRMATIAIGNIGREFPNAPAHELRSAHDLLPPREIHPAFYGSYDWHSAVHQHWLLVRLLRMGSLPADLARQARDALDANLTLPGLEIEAGYLRARPWFERTYGWAWLLMLDAELLASAEVRAARKWRGALRPAVEAVRANWMSFLQRTDYPIRAGVHANTAFGLLLGSVSARAIGDHELDHALIDAAAHWFENDRDYPAHLEPGGDDFLSGALVESALMVHVLDAAAFTRWIRAFLPGIPKRRPPTLFTPARVADRADGKTVHLDGLNLSRAWCWRAIAEYVTDPRLRTEAHGAADAHLEASLPYVFGGEYAGDHWLSSFALLALTGLFPEA